MLASEVAEMAAALSGVSGRRWQRVWKRGRDRWVAVALNFLRPAAAGARMSTPSTGFASSVEGRPAASPVATARRPDGAFRTCDHESRNTGLPEHGWRERENMPMRSGARAFVDPILEGQRKRVRVWAMHDVLSEYSCRPFRAPRNLASYFRGCACEARGCARGCRPSARWNGEA